MYLKNIILLFCVSVYFLQCQGDHRPTRGERRIISDIVDKYANSKGIGNKENGDLNLIGVKEVIEKVEKQFRKTKDKEEIKNKGLCSVEELQTTLSSYVFTLLDVITYVDEYAGLDTDTEKHLLELATLFKQYGGPNTQIKFQHLKRLLDQVYWCKKLCYFVFPYRKFPKTSIPYKLEKSENKFTRDEVEFIVTDYFFPKQIESDNNDWFLSQLNK
ncbi:uncharacterized protein LOC126839590 isoform X2 [Adelges cooleyi]|uniref:uncharacterized protein LOC126839590 isoform X2 n=1 Tax=Adelges cooleyi TaxID=133065 RepID=UPI0021807B2B|nr:uncharacterized protein LOC126839590 isoform X2 [Adelges cooleyi]